MKIAVAIVQAIAILVVPWLIMRAHNNKVVKLFGTIGIAYAAGIGVALVVYIVNLGGVEFALDETVGQYGSHAAIALAIPLLLFSANLREVKKLAKPVLTAFASLTVCVVVVSAVAFFALNRYIANADILCGMAVGLYTGGTPNLNAIAAFFGLDATTIGAANLADTLVGGVFYIFLLTLCKPLFKRFLGEPREDAQYLTAETTVENYETIRGGRLREFKRLPLNFLLSLGICLVGAAIGIGIWAAQGMKDGTMVDFLVPALMITASVLGIACSFIRPVREVKGNNELGLYLILVFSFALSSTLDISQISANIGYVVLLYGGITVLATVLHFLVCKLFRIDVDCAMTTMTAGLYGPAFVPAITTQIKNEKLTAPGLICGALGYALGTFLGMGLGSLFMLC